MSTIIIVCTDVKQKEEEEGVHVDMDWDRHWCSVSFHEITLYAPGPDVHKIEWETYVAVSARRVIFGTGNGQGSGAPVRGALSDGYHGNCAY